MVGQINTQDIKSMDQNHKKLNKSKANSHTQDKHRLSSLAQFTNSIESQGRDSKSRISCEILTCKG
jgi:hypothetical protein